MDTASLARRQLQDVQPALARNGPEQAYGNICWATDMRSVCHSMAQTVRRMSGITAMYSYVHAGWL